MKPEKLKIKEKYLKAPTPQQIIDFVKELGTTYMQFEKFYDMPIGTIRLSANGRRGLPVRFWPIIYEKIVPTYGIKYTKNLIKNENKKSCAKKRTNLIQDIDIKRLNSL